MSLKYLEYKEKYLDIKMNGGSYFFSYFSGSKTNTNTEAINDTKLINKLKQKGREGTLTSENLEELNRLDPETTNKYTINIKNYYTAKSQIREINEKLSEYKNTKLEIEKLEKKRNLNNNEKINLKHYRDREINLKDELNINAIALRNMNKIKHIIFLV